MVESTLLIRGGALITMDAGRRVVPKGDLLISKDRIEAMGPRVRTRAPVRVIDARGTAVLPGLVQSHVHLCQALFRGMADDLPLLDWLRKRIWPLEAAHDAPALLPGERGAHRH